MSIAPEPAADERTAVGVIGLGLVGSALASRLTRAGHAVVGFDREAAAVAAWVQQGGEAADSPAAMASRCAQVVLAVFDTAGVLDVVEGPQGLLAASDLAAPRLIVDCSTGDPDALQALSARLASRGIDFIEAPLSGSSRQIEDGEATMLVGAQPEALARHAALLDALSPQRIAIGGPGMGARAKLATNLVLGLNRAAFAEGLVYAQSQGIAPEVFLDLVLATPARSDAARIKGPLMVSEAWAPPQSRIAQHLKDLRLMLAAATAAGQGLPLTQRHAALLQAALDAGDGDLDNAAIVRQLRRERP